MSPLEQITAFFASSWQAWSDLTHPLLGISFGSILIGVFVVSFSIRILIPILGIGHDAYEKKQKQDRREAWLKNKNKKKGGG